MLYVLCIFEVYRKKKAKYVIKQIKYNVGTE